MHTFKIANNYDSVKSNYPVSQTTKLESSGSITFGYINSKNINLNADSFIINSEGLQKFTLHDFAEYFIKRSPYHFDIQADEYLEEIDFGNFSYCTGITFSQCPSLSKITLSQALYDKISDQIPANVAVTILNP